MLMVFLKKQFLSWFQVFFLSVFLSFQVPSVHADFQSLQPCKESSAFQKRLVNSEKKLTNRLKLYSPGSKENEALLNKIQGLRTRFENYKNSTLLCGKDGLPHLIASGDWKHSGEFILPGILFLYITGWIGWVGRKYIRFVSATANSFEQEIIIDVPVALPFLASGFLWPVEFWKEFTTGDLLASDEEITVSPR